MILPEWVSGFRPQQGLAMTRILAAFERTDLVILDAPTGSGKTLIAEAVRQLLKAPKTMYLCTTKTLQDQFIKDFAYAKVIKGRSNYPTADHPERFNDTFQPLTAADCTNRRVLIPACVNCPPADGHDVEDTHCLYCHPWYDSPYEIAKREAVAASLAVANISYFLNEVNHAGRFCGGALRTGHKTSPHGRDLVIVDEADRLEAELMSFTEVVISKQRAKKYHLDPPKKKTVASSWHDWVHNTAIPTLESRLERTSPAETDLEAVRERKYLTSTLASLKKLDVLNDNWIYTGYETGDIRFKPIRVDSVANDLLWRHGKKWLLMSATVISAQEMAESLGVDNYELVTMPCSFPVARRPIIVRSAANMSRKATVESNKGNWDDCVRGIQRILDDHPGERILVHAVSYELTDFLQTRLTGRPVLGYKSAKERERTLAKFRRTPGAVLVAPSMDRGVDFAYDDCRVVIVAKIPFPYMGDKQVNARMHSRGGEEWYAVQTARTLVQMTGRGMRAPDDECTTYILDGQFIGFERRARHLLPQWWQESVDMTGGVLAQRRKEEALVG